MKSYTQKNLSLIFPFTCSHKSILLGYTLLSLAFGSAQGQECACSPASYKFTFDFGLTCPPVNISQNDGLETSYCQISEFGGPNDNITDKVPADVFHVDIIELGAEDSTVLRQSNVSGSFVSGDSFTFDSIIAQEGNVEVPKIIQLNIYATNALEQPIINIFAIEFTNDCNVYPVLDEGNSAGWVHFTELGVPPRSYCPAIPTEMPSNLPTSIPTAPPSVQPVTPFPTTSLPSMAPSISPVTVTDNPSTSPTSLPTAPPSAQPVSPSPTPSISPVTVTDNPSTSPTLIPTAPPSAQPVSQSPTISPSTSPPSKSPVSVTEMPTTSPTAPPTRSPTGSPGTSPPSISPVPPTMVPTISPAASPTLPPSVQPVTPLPTKAPETAVPSLSQTSFPTVLSMSYDYAEVNGIDFGSDVMEEFGKDFLFPRQKVARKNTKTKNGENGSGTRRRLRVPAAN